MGQLIPKRGVTFEQTQIHLKQDPGRLPTPMEMSRCFSLKMESVDHGDLDLLLQGKVVCINSLYAN